MRYRFIATMLVTLASMDARVVLGEDKAELPIRAGRPAVAAINDGSIALDELLVQLDLPVDRARLLGGLATPGELAVLDRLIASRLVAQEAATMGLGDLAEIRKQVDVYSRESMRDVLLDGLVKDITPDPAAVEAAYKDLAREWKTSSLLFKDEPSAARVQEQLATGGDYAALAAKAVADLGATAESDDAYHSRKEYLPEVLTALGTLEVGQVSPVIRIEAGFVVLKVLDIRYPENEAARAEAHRSVLDRQRQEFVMAHERALQAEHAVVNAKLLDDLDYTATDIAELLKDTRVLAELKGADSVTVGDLTDYMRMQFYHGGDQAAQGKRLNARKRDALDSTIARRLLNAEARRLGIDETDAYLDRINAYEESLVFGAFVQKVILPESKLREEDVKAYYDQNVKDYSSPRMVRVRGVAFVTRAAAEEAMRTLRDGADYGWLVASAEGQVDKGTQGLLTFDGRPVTTTSLPDGLQKTVADAKAGDVRLYESPEGHYYLVVVQQVIEPVARPYDEVRQDIAKKLYGEKVTKSVEDYAAKLRALAKVEVYLKKAE